VAEVNGEILRNESNCAIGQAMGACSACAGDYEDPDRTARTAEEVDDGEEERAPGTVEEKFPAE
jgi:hypothetical protein